MPTGASIYGVLIWGLSYSNSYYDILGKKNSFLFSSSIYSFIYLLICLYIIIFCFFVHVIIISEISFFLRKGMNELLYHHKH